MSEGTNIAPIGTTPKAAQQPIPPPVTDDGKELILQGRIRSPESALGLYNYLFQADLPNSRNRSVIDSALGGFPPYSEANNKRIGQFGRTNVNWRHLLRAFQQAVAPYDDILESMDPLCDIPTNYGTDAEKDWIEPILAEGFSIVMRNWSQFIPLWQQTTRLFNAEGVACEMWRDEWDWRWLVKGMQQVKFPRGVPPSIDSMDCWSIQVDELCSDLFKYIMYPDRAELLGWRPKQVQAAISKAAPISIQYQDLQAWQKLAKDLDILPQGTAPMVRTIHTVAKELDQTISHYISLYDGGGDWLYQKLGKYKEAKRFMALYTADVGTNGDLHSIRGLPHHLFNASVAIDRALSASADAVIQSATSVLQAPSEDALNSMPFRQIGSNMALNEGWKFIKQETPRFQDTLDPWYERCLSVFEAGISSPRQQKGPYVSDKQQEQLVMAGSALTAGQMALFFSQKQMALREVIRRMKRKTYSQNEPGGREVWDLLNFLKKRGVPLEAWYQVDESRIQINSGLGRGSLAARQAMIDRLMTQFLRYDEAGQQKLLRMFTTANGSARLGRELVPQVQGLRPPQDLEDADNENIGLTSGNPIMAAMVRIKPNQNNQVHCGSHCAALTLLFQQNAAGILPPSAALAAMEPTHKHATEHWKRMDPSDPLYGEYKDTLQQMDQFIINEGKHLAKLQQQAQEAQSQGQQPPGGVAPDASANGSSNGAPKDVDSPGMLREAIESSQELQLQERKHAWESQEAATKVQGLQLENALKVQKLQQGAMGGQ